MSAVKIIKAPSDPICSRVSVGGGSIVPGVYCVYRGSRDQAISLLESAVAALKEARNAGPEPAINRSYKELGAS